MSYRIALVDDDENIRTSVAMALEAEGFDVSDYPDGQAAVDVLIDQPTDLVVLDIKMPRMDGMEVLKKLKEVHETVPVIFLTSKDDEIDQLLGLRMGADDYITKPFSQRLLIERIRTILRRHAQIADAQETKAEEKDLMTRGELTLDDQRHLCSWKGQPLDITVTEYLLIKCLAQHPGHVKNRDQLMDYAYGESIYVDDRTIDSHVKRIRKKFKQLDTEFGQIETVYGIGYRYKE